MLSLKLPFYAIIKAFLKQTVEKFLRSICRS